MFVVADTRALETDGVITRIAAREIEARSRQVMVALAINALLCAGILFATVGLIVWLADALSVAICGLAMLVAGLAVLTRGDDLYAMFGNAATLIGAGLLIGGAGLELWDKYPDLAGRTMLTAGAVVAAAAALTFRTGPAKIHFATGAITLMGAGLHLTGLGYLLVDAHLQGPAMPLFYLYAAGVTALAGWFVDVRFVTALAIAPFAQALDTGTFYFHAAYVFYSPEPALSILQLGLLAAASVWAAAHWAERDARHARVVSVMAFIVANLCALVGSLWGDVVGETIWGPRRTDFADYTAHRDAVDAFRATAFSIHEHVFTILWAAALVAMILWSAHTNRRALFNTAVTFGGIHAYTQVFETFYDEPLAYVIGGLAAVPLAWGMWRLNQHFLTRNGDHTSAG